MNKIKTFQNYDKLVIIDGRVPFKKLKYFKDNNYFILPTVACKEIQEPIAYHPDVVIHPIGDKKIIVAPNVYNYYNDILKEFGFTVIKGRSHLAYKYPKDSYYNVANTGKYVIHNLKITDKILKDYLENSDKCLINVNQGYSKCSIGIISKDRIITSDKGIYNSISTITSKIDILLIEKGHIELKGYNYGFIGGTLGLVDSNKVGVAGSLSSHPDGEKIKKYIRLSGKEIVELWEGNLKDIGSIYYFEV